tara:strand:+ start:1355 stop:1771 length:417 start_codon:yes stop_codon:yes gene_type:complete
MAKDKKASDGRVVLEAGSKVDFHYQKSPQYRSIHCDGMYGGLTTRGYVSVTFYNERTTLPRRSTREVITSDDGDGANLGPEVVEDSLEGVMRQLEATVFFDLTTAREFHAWFTNKLTLLEQHLGQQASNNPDIHGGGE